MVFTVFIIKSYTWIEMYHDIVLTLKYTNNVVSLWIKVKIGGLKKNGYDEIHSAVIDLYTASLK